jgi:hypothetical protein
MPINPVSQEHIDNAYAPSPAHGRAMGARTAMRIPKAIDTQLRAIAKQDGVLISDVVRCALEAYVKYRTAQI